MGSPKTKAEIEAMTDKQLFNMNWWNGMLRRGETQAVALMRAEVERRRQEWNRSGVYGDGSEV
jgi:hypothetical protein